jgi:mannose-6-phosphate isomerase-like protein (cupin superfamily)
VLVRRKSEAALHEWHSLRSHILMDAGELGSRHMSVVWIEVPPGGSERLHSHEEAEQVYVVVGGTGSMSAAGDTEELAPGDLAMIPPATDHEIANGGDEDLAVVSVQSPAVAIEELYERQLAGRTAGYDQYDEDDEGY